MTTTVRLDPDGATAPPRHWVDVAGWVAAVAAVVVAIVVPLRGTFAVMPVFVLALLVGVCQGVRRYGGKLLVTFFVVAFVLSNFFEDLSIETGFPFGHYHYSGGAKLIDVPIMIGIIYFGLGYVCWMTANAILGRADEHLDLRTRTGRLNVVALPVLAGAVMTMFDVSSDATSSTLAGTWIWHDGGGVFGVPYTNYLGWWFVTWSYFQVFTLILARRQTRRDGDADFRTVPLAQPVLIYLSSGIVAITYFIGATLAPTVTDRAGQVWNTHALLETGMTSAIFGVVVMGLLALARLAQERSQGVDRPDVPVTLA